MKKIALVLTAGFADWEYALIGGIGGPFYGLDVQYFTPCIGEIRSQGGLTVIVSRDFEELSLWQPNAVVIVGGSIWETDKAPDIGHVLKTQYAGGAVVAGICGGTLVLARAGLLENVRHTSNDPGFLSKNAKDYSGSDFYFESASAVYEDRIITAPGTAPVSFTAAVFESVGLDKQKVQQFKGMLAAEHAA